MTLTLYAATVVFLNSPLDQFSPVGGYVFQVVAVLLFALGWRQAVGRGPLETAVTAVANWARDGAVRATSRERHPSEGDSESISWSENEAEGSRAEDAWPTWEDEADWSAAESSERGPGRWRRARSAERGWATSTASDEDVWSWWEDEVEAQPADSSSGSERNPDSTTSSRGI
jgi:hypothetical protein